MAGILACPERSRPTGERTRRRRKNVQRFSRRLICCSCLRAEEAELVPGKVEQGEGEPRAPGLGQEGSVERNTFQITVEDVGLVNPGFCLSEEEEEEEGSPPLGGAMARSVSGCQRAMKKKKKLRALSSLPLQARSKAVNLPATEEDDDEEEEEEEDDDPLLFGNDSPAASGILLMPPLIHLIPPTPSVVIDDDQFFDANSEDESVAHTSGSDDSGAAEDRGGCEERTETQETQETNQTDTSEEGPDTESGEGDPVGESQDGQADEKEKAASPGEEGKEKPKRSFLRSAYQVAPLPEYPRKRSFNTGVNLLSFTEHNLDDLSNKDASFHELLKAELRLLPLSSKLDSFTHLRKAASRSCSVGDTVTRSHTFHSITQATVEHQEEEGSPRQRRITVASYMSQSKDQNGNFDVKDSGRQGAKAFGDLNVDEVCQWFSNIGLPKCLPFVREAGLCGADVASVNADTLQLLHVTGLEEREQLLSAIYKEIHPPNPSTQRLDSILETYGPYHVERFTAALASMSKSKSSSHVSCVHMNRCPLKLRSKSQNYMVQRNSRLIEITINASEQIVHLRTPTETTVGKVMESCIKMLGMSESKELFSLRDGKDSSEVLSPEQQIGSLPTSENQQLELHLCKKDKPKDEDSQVVSKGNSSQENGAVNQNLQGNPPLGKEEKIRELNQQVDSLKNVILQVQELHHGLVAFCSELKKMEGEVDVAGLGSAELEQRLEGAQGRLRDQRQNLQALKDVINNTVAPKYKRSEVRLLEKMKMNCRVFKEEISLVHVNRQVAHLQSSLQECQDKEKAQKKCSALSSLSQLVSPLCPAMLLVVQENQRPDGRYGFSCSRKESRGLVVVQVDNSLLCLHDRLVEVNGVPVVGYSEDELNALLLQGASAQIVVLRRPPPSLPSQQHTLPGHHGSQEPITMATDRINATEIPQHRELMAI